VTGDFAGERADGARLHGSRLVNLKGAASLLGVTIDTTQILPMARSIFAPLGLKVDDERE
jgi:hypothetical protein